MILQLQQFPSTHTNELQNTGKDVSLPQGTFSCFIAIGSLWANRELKPGRLRRQQECHLKVISQYYFMLFGLEHLYLLSWPGLLEVKLVSTSFKYQDNARNPYYLVGTWLALTMLQACEPWNLIGVIAIDTKPKKPKSLSSSTFIK